MPKKKATPSPVRADRAFQEALRKAYIERAKLFVEGLKQRRLNALKQSVAAQSPPKSWPVQRLGISRAAMSKVRRSGVQPHLVFCHPDIIKAAPELTAYYRNLAALSKKGLQQIVAGLSGPQRQATAITAMNQIISAIVDDLDAFDLALAQAIIPVEIGAELQGTWVNIIGQGAAKRVKTLIEEYVQNRRLAEQTETKRVPGVKGKTVSQTQITLIDGWTIIFAAEPDVSIRDKKGTLRVVIEVKGSLDKAGAQTRYGKAKKSFAKALAENAQCETVYLASCFTDAVHEQIRQDAQVRLVFNLVEVLADNLKRDEFLSEIFEHRVRIAR